MNISHLNRNNEYAGYGYAMVLSILNSKNEQDTITNDMLLKSQKKEE